MSWVSGVPVPELEHPTLTTTRQLLCVGELAVVAELESLSRYRDPMGLETSITSIRNWRGQAGINRIALNYFVVVGAISSSVRMWFLTRTVKIRCSGG